MSERLSPATESWRPQRREPMFDPQMRRMAVIAGGAAVVLALGIGGYAMLGRRTHGVPVIEADSRPLRVKPDNPGGMQVAGAEEQIMGGSGTGQADAMAPAPEVPQPQVLRAQIQAAREAAPPAPPPEVPQPQLLRQLQTARQAPPQAQPVSLASPPAAISAAPEQHPIAPPATHAPAAHAAATGGTEVQLAALETEQAAMNEWHRLEKRLPDVMSAHKPAVMKAERDGKTFYRLRTGGFTDIASATAFCTQLKAKGAGCAIASF
ncbi:SPOR domain-containing protein [Acidisphaera sp. L21]|uniref:SPOR domain-containing protein n=1 Tax=Acidisphaera sp. L21 TaxID=1641851 RepID=UPI00131EB572|nr:SPOR domain-containing protein [Acidisphaera sp. L21]